ncbi:MAG: glycosyltransferase family 4 protein [Candidatus Eisenbacteria bacterium]|nr:glycosyltransferase family 4 protein [Candidatus Eisenbacteria bacterium]
MRRGRIWFVTRALPEHGGGGMERVVRETAFGLAARGWRIDLVVPRPPIPVDAPEGVEIHPLDAPHHVPTARLGRALLGWAADRKETPDLLFSAVLSAGTLAARRPEIPSLFQAHGSSWAEATTKLRAGDPRGLFRFWLWAGAERRALPRFDRIVAVGPAVRAYFESRAYRFLDPARIVEIPNGIDLRLFADGEARRRRVRQEFAVGAEERVILAACRLIPEKGVGDLLRAFERMEGRERTRLWIAGSGRDETRLRAYVREKGLDRVAFFGALPRERVIDLVHGADLTAQVGTRPEGLPLLVLESLVAGTPALVSERMPLPLFGGESSVMRARPGDADSIARAVAEGLRLGAPRPDTAAAARERFSLERTLDDYEKVIAEILEERRKPG